MKDKFYFEIGGSECCEPLQSFIDRIDDEEKEIHLYLAKRAYGSEFMWCVKEGEIIEQGDFACGKHNCTNYEPRNKKSGRCRWLENTFEEIGKELILTKDGLKEKQEVCTCVNPRFNFMLADESKEICAKCKLPKGIKPQPKKIEPLEDWTGKNMHMISVDKKHFTVVQALLDVKLKVDELVEAYNRRVE